MDKQRSRSVRSKTSIILLDAAWAILRKRKTSNRLQWKALNVAGQQTSADVRLRPSSVPDVSAGGCLAKCSYNGGHRRSAYYCDSIIN